MELSPELFDPLILTWLIAREGWAWLRRQRIRLRLTVNSDDEQAAVDLAELSE